MRLIILSTFFIGIFSFSVSNTSEENLEKMMKEQKNHFRKSLKRMLPFDWSSLSDIKEQQKEKKEKKVKKCYSNIFNILCNTIDVEED